MAAVELEINSFVSKFAQLCVCGINASLNFTNSNGSLSANLQAEIGHFNSVTNLSSNNKNNSSSRSRRRKRRQKERSETNLCVEADVSAVDGECEEIGDSSISDEMLTNTVMMKPTIDPPPLEAVLTPSQMNIDSPPSIREIEFGEGVSELLNAPSTEPPAANASSPTIEVSNDENGSPHSHGHTPKLPISQKEFFEYMETFSESLGSLIQKNLNLPNDPS